MCDSIEIQQYLEQLSQVEQALELCENEEEKISLESLKNDLNELLQLTIQTQQQQEQLQEESNGSCEKTDKSGSNLKNGTTKANTAGIDDEMALFMSEIKKIETTSNDVKECVEEKEAELKLEDIKEELLAMVGQKCSAPHQHSWGSIAYHNALICGIDNTKEYELDDVQDFCVRVLFTNPTHQEMLPCSYYLEGECRFDVDKCRYSHGELIPFRELKEYHEPDFTKLEKHCIVLAKMNDKLWHKGRVLTANFETKSCLVRIDRGKKDIDCKFEDLLPMFYDEDLTSDSSTDANDSECESDGDSNLTSSDHYLDAAKQAKLIERSLLSPNANQKLGEWEKHTKGFGSKILQKLGYVVGTGLGTNGEGIVIPISAQVLPPGRSLDHCMELRELANGDENLFSVERKMKKEQKRAEAQSAKQYEKETNRTDMFSFLNQNILTGVGGSNGDINDQNNRPNSMNQQKPKPSDYKNHSVKNLNVESVRLADDIRRKEKEIDQLKESMKRHTTGTDIHKKMQKMMSVKDQELDNLKKSEHYLSKEQNSRKNKSKLDIF